jgi:hypothetical protein
MDSPASPGLRSDLPAGTLDNETNEKVVCAIPLTTADFDNPNDCYQDSASNQHVFNRRDVYRDITPVKIPGFSQGSMTAAFGAGDVMVKGEYMGEERTFKIKDCLYVPKARANLISQVRLDKIGVSAWFDDGKVTLYRDGAAYRRIAQKRHVQATFSPYPCQLRSSFERQECYHYDNQNRSWAPGFLHRLMGHIGVKGLKDAVDGLEYEDESSYPCDICARANVKKLPLPEKSNWRASRVLERMHSDICGPFPTGYNGYRYFLLFIDEHSCYIFIYFLVKRSEAVECFKPYKAAVETLHGTEILYFRCDNAPEYVEGELRKFRDEDGPIRENSTGCITTE